MDSRFFLILRFVVRLMKTIKNGKEKKKEDRDETGLVLTAATISASALQLAGENLARLRLRRRRCSALVARSRSPRLPSAYYLFYR